MDVGISVTPRIIFAHLVAQIPTVPLEFLPFLYVEMMIHSLSDMACDAPCLPWSDMWNEPLCFLVGYFGPTSTSFLSLESTGFSLCSLSTV